jgi:hypothetical protein
MKIARLILPAILALAPAAAFAATPPDFDSLLSALEQHYSTHAERVPLMGFVSFCAWVSTGGGVRGMKVADFNNLPGSPSPAEVESFIEANLGGEWQHFVTDHERDEVSLIYVQPHGSSMRMMIADYDHGELDLVRMDVNGERLAHWVQNPVGSAQERNPASGGRGSGTPD